MNMPHRNSVSLANSLMSLIVTGLAIALVLLPAILKSVA
jgi:hypothetical protein